MAFPPSLLSICKKETLKKKDYKTPEGVFALFSAFVGTPEGGILTYSGWQNTTNSKKPSLFKLDIEGQNLGLSNNARGSISSWTNQKNNALHFDQQTNSFELRLTPGGKRVYNKHSSQELYVLTYEILPSGNKIFYKYNDHGHLIYLQMTNASENKVLSWIKLDYGDGGSSSRDGDRVHAETSDGKKLEYQFEKDPSGILLLSKVINSDKPDLHYLYQITDKRALLTRKELPEGRFVEIAYYPAGENEHKVASITTPINNKQVNTTQFSYTLDQNGNGATEVTEASVRKSIYLFNHEFQLIGIENYLNGCLYRKYIKSWGKEKDMGNLVGASIQDAKGATFYYKLFSYDEKGNILEEKEYGNLTGAHPGPIVLDEQGLPSKDQESFTKTYSYSTKKEEYIVCKEDAKGNGIKLFYKKGSNLLLEKLTLGRGPKKRYVYKYNEDAALIQTTIDNSSSEWEVVSHLRKRLITSISPKKDLPNVGATEILEKKYLDTQTGKEVSSKKILNKFDSSGNITSQEIYDSNGELRYATKRRCENGLLLSETDPMGNETFYTYDANHNLMSKYLSASELTFEYQYDLRNFLIAATEREKKGQSFTITRSYDSMGNILSEADRLGNKPFTPMTNLAAFFPLPILKFMI